jgi:hypothetical protein
MTDETRQTQKTLKEMSHTAPYTDKAFGDAMVYRRGPVVAADGGEDPSREERNESDRLVDIDHTPPHGESVNRVYERGTEGRDESA